MKTWGVKVIHASECTKEILVSHKAEGQTLPLPPEQGFPGLLVLVPQHPIAGQERLAASYWEQGSLLCLLFKGQKEFSPALHLPGMSFKRKKEEVKNKH